MSLCVPAMAHRPQAAQLPVRCQVVTHRKCPARRRKKDHGRAEALLIAAWSYAAQQKASPPAARVQPEILTTPPEPEDGGEDPVQALAELGEPSGMGEQLMKVLVDMCNELPAEQPSERRLRQVSENGNVSMQSPAEAGEEAGMNDVEFAAWKQAVRKRMIDSFDPSKRELVAAVLNAYEGGW